jgi:hypothetical protein
MYIIWAKKYKLMSKPTRFAELMFWFPLIKQNSIKSFKCDKFVATFLKQQASVKRSVTAREHS